MTWTVGDKGSEAEGLGRGSGLRKMRKGWRKNIKRDISLVKARIEDFQV